MSQEQLETLEFPDCNYMRVGVKEGKFTLPEELGIDAAGRLAAVLGRRLTFDTGMDPERRWRAEGYVAFHYQPRMCPWDKKWYIAGYAFYTPAPRYFSSKEEAEAWLQQQEDAFVFEKLCKVVVINTPKGFTGTFDIFLRRCDRACRNDPALTRLMEIRNAESVNELFSMANIVFDKAVVFNPRKAGEVWGEVIE